MKIAVVGSGISGLSAAYYLSKNHHVDLFEKEDHFGGHSYTVEIPTNNKNGTISVDLGFIVFNKTTYPNLVKLFETLHVKYEKSNMSFSVSVKGSNIEYSGSGIRGLFGNRYNFLDLNFMKMVKEIFSFYKMANKIKSESLEKFTLGEFLKTKKMSNYFIKYHILPMVSAIWSSPADQVYKMPMSLFISFFQNHGLFKIKNRPQWYTVSGRSKTYVNKILKTINGEYFKNYKITKVLRNQNNVRLYYGSLNEYFDYEKVIIAVHADNVLSLISNPTEEEEKIFRNFKYKKNIAYLHTDENLMPLRKNIWSSWNSILNTDSPTENCVTYWLNKLQNLRTDKNYFLTLNPIVSIDEKKVIKKIEFTHPIYDINAVNAQKSLPSLQGINNTWFCGSYFGYGFHEDGLKSAIDISKKL